VLVPWWRTFMGCLDLIPFAVAIIGLVFTLLGPDPAG
jgi:hypothetical protein